MKNLAQYIEHTLLKPDATESQIRQLCSEASEYGFHCVCVHPCRVAKCASLLSGTGIAVCTTIGFPLGASKSSVKALEASEAIADGADEVDMVINIGALKDRNYDLVRSDIEAVVKAAGGRALVKVIIETCLLTDEEKEKACIIARAAGADFVKSSTGFSFGGATQADIRLMRDTVGEDMGVKAAGGIRNLESARAMISAGASRLGTSASVAIAEEEKKLAAE